MVHTYMIRAHKHIHDVIAQGTPTSTSENVRRIPSGIVVPRSTGQEDQPRRRQHIVYLQLHISLWSRIKIVDIGTKYHPKYGQSSRRDGNIPN